VSRTSEQISGAARSRRRGEPPKAKDAHWRIRGFPKAIIDEIDHRLLAGDGYKSIAYWLQNDKRLATDVVEQTLVQNLKRYKESLRKVSPKKSVPVTVEAIEAEGGPVMIAEVTSFLDTVEAIDEMEVMAAAIRYQSARIDMHKALEQMIKRPTRSCSEDLELLSRMCVRSHDIRMDRGKFNIDSTSIRPELRQRVTESYGEEIAEAMETPESSAKVLSLFHQLKRQAAAMNQPSQKSPHVPEDFVENNDADNVGG